MGEVIHAEFGAERMWKQAHNEATDYLVAFGEACGDDETLMRAKADRFHGLLRSIVEEVPQLQLSCELPADLTPEQLEAVRHAIHEAARAALAVGLNHAVRTVTECAPALCTSMLARADR